MKFRIRNIFSVVWALSALLLSGLGAQVHAVELADDGIGDVLIMPYYTVRTVQDRDGFPAGQYQAFLDISNSSSQTVAFRLNIREAQSAKLCAKLNVVLSPQDVWTAAIQETATGVRLFTVDKSCTSPQMTPVGNGAELFLSTTRFTGFFDDAGPNTIARCKEGFVEVIAMGHSIASNSNAVGKMAYNAKHVNGIPRNCSLVHQAFEDDISNVRDEFNEPTNALKGMYTLINVANGIGYGGEFVALANFFSPDISNGEGLDGKSALDLIFPGTGFFDVPNLNVGNPKESVVRIANRFGEQRTLIDQWDRGVDAVSAVFQRSRAINQWTTNANLGAETAWVVTMPTFLWYTGSTPIDPFEEVFSANAAILDGISLPRGGACNRVGVKLYNRHEEVLATRFTPQNTGTSPVLCYAVNPITFNGANLMGSKIARNINSSGALNGWMDLNFLPSANPLFFGGLGSVASGPGSNTGGDYYGGLPVIAVAFTIRAREEASTNYGTLWQHSYDRFIDLPGFDILPVPIDPIPFPIPIDPIPIDPFPGPFPFPPIIQP